jgi:hypothetical protein
MKSHRPRTRRIAALALAGTPADHRRQLAGATIGAGPGDFGQPVARASQPRDTPIDDPGASRTPRVRRPVTIGVVASGARSCATSTRFCLNQGRL